MTDTPKLFLYSLSLTAAHNLELEKLTGKEAKDIRFACIDNATDIIKGAETWMPGIRKSLIKEGYQVETVDLRKYFGSREELREKLRSKDVIWVCGGHTYYLRWILKESGADTIIRELVAAGKVYAGWSAGAIMAGPTTKFIDLMGDDPAEAPEIIYDGMNLMDAVIVPHIDNSFFSKGAIKANNELVKAGFKTILLKDNQACIVQNDGHTII